MAKPTAQQCHALTSYFISSYKNSRGHAPVVNRNKARWGFDAMLMDYLPERVKVLIDYYINHWDLPTLDWFLYNYEKVDERKQEQVRRDDQQAKRLKETEQRLKEWKKRWEKN